MSNPSDFTSPAPSGSAPADSGAGVPAAPEVPVAGAAESEPAFPARSTTGAWYDSPTGEELDRGKLAPEAPQSGQSGETLGDNRSLMSNPGYVSRQYADFPMPEGMTSLKLDPTGLHELNTLIDSKVRDHDGFQAQGFRDALLNKHLTEMGRLQREMQAHQIKTWNDTNAQWKEAARKEFGNRLEMELATAKGVIEEFGGSREQQAELLSYADFAGFGNHPAVIRLLANIGKKLGVFENNMVGGNPTSRGAPGGGKRGWYDRS